MRRLLSHGFAALMLACLPACATTSPAPHASEGHGTLRTAPPGGGAPLLLSARTLRTYAAPEADQGAAVDADFFYAIDNALIAKYSRSDGARLAEWRGPESGEIRHINSCYADAGRLWCANSNYPQVPMGSSVEVFDAAQMTHEHSHSLGMMEEGSLTWFAPIDGGWIGAFAHYDERGVAYKDHRFSALVAFDSSWRRTGGWLFPPGVIERMAPHAASGGAIGPDGFLYVMGHDRPEMYVLARPHMGPTLVHVATIALEAEGQAFAFDRASTERVIFCVDRRAGLVREIQLPDPSSH